MVRFQSPDPIPCSAYPNRRCSCDCRIRRPSFICPRCPLALDEWEDRWNSVRRPGSGQDCNCAKRLRARNGVACYKIPGYSSPITVPPPAPIAPFGGLAPPGRAPYAPSASSDSSSTLIHPFAIALAVVTRCAQGSMIRHRPELHCVPTMGLDVIDHRSLDVQSHRCTCSAPGIERDEAQPISSPLRTISTLGAIAPHLIVLTCVHRAGLQLRTVER